MSSASAINAIANQLSDFFRARCRQTKLFRVMIINQSQIIAIALEIMLSEF